MQRHTDENGGARPTHLALVPVREYCLQLFVAQATHHAQHVVGLGNQLQQGREGVSVAKMGAVASEMGSCAKAPGGASRAAEGGGLHSHYHRIPRRPTSLHAHAHHSTHTYPALPT